MPGPRRWAEPSNSSTSAPLVRECRAAVMFAWACAEATVWPIVPDFLLVPLAAGRRQFLYIPLFASVLGTAVAGTLLYAFAMREPAQALAFLSQLPMVNAHQVQLAGAQLADHGAAAFWIQPWSGVPFKVWGILAGAQGIDPLAAVPTFIAARALRMTIYAGLAGLLAARFHRYVRDFSLYLGLAYTILFFYGWWRVVQ